MNNGALYSTLTRFGDYYPLSIRHDDNFEELIETLDTNYIWPRYNPRKDIDRDGLSITSMDGGLSGYPDLDSLYEYFEKTGISLHEDDFKTKTPVYNYFKKWLDPFDGHLGRTHVIRLNKGGFFPPHRDNKASEIKSFRLFLPLNYDSTHFFLLEDTRMKFTNGQFYFIDTAKMHTLFNANETPFYFVVTNVILSQDSVDTTLEYLTG